MSDPRLNKDEAEMLSAAIAASLADASAKEGSVKPAEPSQDEGDTSGDLAAARMAAAKAMPAEPEQGVKPASKVIALAA